VRERFRHLTLRSAAGLSRRDNSHQSLIHSGNLQLPATGCPFIFANVKPLPPKRLHHEIPLWVNPHREIYFITINCEERFRKQLTVPETAEKLFETVRHRQEKFLWWPHIFLLMPDHLHALLSFPPADKPIRLIVSKWKEWTAKEIGIRWQGDFFEHRLRHDESRRQKVDYILENPFRKKLVKRIEDWPYVYFGDGRRPNFPD
jgi:REP element-mobilizing transposase RayT